MRFLTNMKVATKLLLLLVIMAIGFGAVGVTYIEVLNTEQEVAVATQKISQYHAAIKEFEHQVAAAVTEQRDFMVSAQTEALERFESKMSESRKLVTKLSAEAPNEQIKQFVQEAAQILITFHSAFYQVAESQFTLGLQDTEQNSGLTGDMRNVIHDLESTLYTLRDAGDTPEKKLLHEKLLVSMLTMRRYEKDFIVRENPKYAKRMAKEQEHFQALIEDPELAADTRAHLADKITIYHNFFNDLVEVTLQKKQDIESLNTAFTGIAPVLDNLVETVTNISTALRAAQDVKRQRLTTVFIGVLGGTTIVVALLVLFLGRSITNPLRRLQATVQQLVQGNMNIRARLHSRDEIGTFANAFDNLLDERVARLAEAEHENEALNNSIVILLQAVAQLSERDLTVKVPVAEDVTGPVSDALNLLSEETANVLGEVTRISDAVAEASRRVKTQSDTVVALANSERAQVTQTSDQLGAAAEAMNAIAALAQACDRAAENAIKKTQAALQSVTNTVGGINATRDTIRETEKRIKRLGERSQEISGAVNLINSIAERTHILALNASMHAASAGEAGRGFAVVADEVQRLAENARQSTEQISSLVSNIQTETLDTVAIMNTVITQVVEGSRMAEEAGAQMRDTQETTADLVASVRQITEGSQKQAQVSNELRHRASEIVASTIQTNQQLEAQGVQTNRLLEYASRLVTAVRIFKLPEQPATAAASEAETTFSEAADEEQGALAEVAAD